jgi:hypothetical protein
VQLDLQVDVVSLVGRLLGVGELETLDDLPRACLADRLEVGFGQCVAELDEVVADLVDLPVLAGQRGESLDLLLGRLQRAAVDVLQRDEQRQRVLRRDDELRQARFVVAVVVLVLFRADDFERTATQRGLERDGLIDLSA